MQQILLAFSYLSWSRQLYGGAQEAGWDEAESLSQAQAAGKLISSGGLKWEAGVPGWQTAASLMGLLLSLNV